MYLWRNVLKLLYFHCEVDIFSEVVKTLSFSERSVKVRAREVGALSVVFHGRNAVEGSGEGWAEVG